MTRIPLLAATLGVAAALSAQTHGTTMFHFPRWSPDGQSIVLTTNVDGGPDEEIWIVAADGSTRRRLTDNSLTDTAADWHDAKTIVFQRVTHRGEETMAMDADGGNIRPFTAASSPVYPVVEQRRTADGQAVFFLAGPGQQARLNTVRWAEQPVLSPDRSVVAFEQRDNPNDIPGSDIALWDVRTRSLTIATRGTDPSWSPDGRLLMFKAPIGATGALHIQLFDRASRRIRTLVAGVHPHFSPDGQRIAFMGDSARMDVHIIRTDGTGQSCLTCSWK